MFGGEVLFIVLSLSDLFSEKENPNFFFLVFVFITFFFYCNISMSNLQQLVKNKFAAAKESKDLVSFETTQTEKESSGIKVKHIYI